MGLSATKNNGEKPMEPIEIKNYTINLNEQIKTNWNNETTRIVEEMN